MSPRWVAACATQRGPGRCRTRTQNFNRNEQTLPTTALIAASCGNHLCYVGVFDSYRRIPSNANRSARLWFALLDVVWAPPVLSDKQSTADGHRAAAGDHVTQVRSGYVYRFVCNHFRPGRKTFSNVVRSTHWCDRPGRKGFRGGLSWRQDARGT